MGTAASSDGRNHGVRSTSKLRPIKQNNFPLVVRHFQGKPTHHDWVFQHPSPSQEGAGATHACGWGTRTDTHSELGSCFDTD